MSAEPDFTVFFIEDDATLRKAMVQALELDGIRVKSFATALPALQELDPEFAGVVVSDIRLPGMSGTDFYTHLRAVDSDLPMIFTTGHGDVGMAVSAIKDGAADFLTKPYSSGHLIESIRSAAEKRLLVLENRRLRNALGAREPIGVIGSSGHAKRLRQMIRDIAAVDIDLMISGESGTGKNFVAEKIHSLGLRRDRPFVTVDAGTVMHKDAELIIFGHAPGSGLSRAGLIERANGGTLYLDQVELMPEAFQSRLLSLIERRKIQPIGSERELPVNIRVISATRMPDSEPQGTIAQPTPSAIYPPLYHRLSGIAINLPPLSLRSEDAPEFLRHFMLEYEAALNLKADPLSDRDWHYLQTHDWPGNLWELRSFARRLVLGLATVDTAFLPDTKLASLTDRVAGFERAVLVDALQQHGGRVASIAAALKLPRKTLYDKLAKHNLHPRAYRAGDES